MKVVFSSWQDPKSWEPNVDFHGDAVVITCATNADAKKAEQLYNDLLRRAEKAESTPSQAAPTVPLPFTADPVSGYMSGYKEGWNDCRAKALEPKGG